MPVRKVVAVSQTIEVDGIWCSPQFTVHVSRTAPPKCYIKLNIAVNQSERLSTFNFYFFYNEEYWLRFTWCRHVLFCFTLCCWFLWEQTLAFALYSVHQSLTTRACALRFSAFKVELLTTDLFVPRKVRGVASTCWEWSPSTKRKKAVQLY